MKTSITLLTFSITSIVMFSAGYLTAKKLLEERYAMIAQEEIDSVKEVFERRHEKETTEEINCEACNDDENVVIMSREESFRRAPNPLERSTLVDNPYELAKRNYNIFKGTDADKAVSAKEEAPITDAAGMTEEDMQTQQDVDSLPYIIDDIRYNEECDGYDKISLFYYAKDDILCEENEDIVDDIENTIGYDALSELDRKTTVWVRNDKISTDYEIIRMNTSYTEMVYGEVRTSARDGKSQIQKRRKLSDE